MRVILIEDNAHIGRYVVESLKEEGYAVDWYQDGTTGLRHALHDQPDLVLLDRMLPGTDGVVVSADLRQSGCAFPILMLTALGDTEERVEGLDSGADDYLVKPFEMQELLARVRALLRRPSERTEEILRAQDIELHTVERRATRDGADLSLTAKEYCILEYLMHHVDRVVTRADLLEHCWEFAYNPFSNITDVYIRRLRKKLHDDQEQYIETLRGVGYKLKG